MSLRDKIHERAAPHVPPGETFVVSFQAEEPLLKVASILLLPWPRVVIVTDKRVHLFTSSPWRVCEPRRLLRSFPLSTLTLSNRVLLKYVIRLSDETLWVNFAYRDFLREALAFTKPATGMRLEHADE
ncbi:MAG: hypothetical protein FJW30_25690 [Acidobacteria bacterium]|nr:hypothetical protein [Acidobacteriota bacterium]